MLGTFNIKGQKKQYRISGLSHILFHVTYNIPSKLKRKTNTLHGYNSPSFCHKINLLIPITFLTFIHQGLPRCRRHDGRKELSPISRSHRLYRARKQWRNLQIPFAYCGWWRRSDVNFWSRKQLADTERRWHHSSRRWSSAYGAHARFGRKLHCGWFGLHYGRSGRCEVSFVTLIVYVFLFLAVCNFLILFSFSVLYA